MDRVCIDAAVIGAGAIGLAAGAQLSSSGIETYVFERTALIGSGISSRNSEVVHSGIYYETGSLKHITCIEGRRKLYAYCDARGILYRKCEKLIVATEPAETAKIEMIAARALQNNVEGTTLIDRTDVLKLEPEVNAVAALHVRETCIIDSHAYMFHPQADIEAAGGAVLFGHRLISAHLTKDGVDLDFQLTSGEMLVVSAARLVLAVGPWNHAVMALIEGLDAKLTPTLRLGKGSYFAYHGRPVFTRLIYPVPVDGGLGTHQTLDLNGRMRFGPDVEWLDTDDPDAVDFAVQPARGERFYSAIRRYLLALPDDSLVPDYSGVRPKLSGPGEPAADFLISGPQQHGVDRLALLLGIESPGLTSSLAIAERVLEVVR